ncbi:MAG TPA: hypothetical protein VIJ14_10330 [Rhabdochlamydiaceae bacterium]
MSAIMGLIISHLLTVVENELIKEEPAMVAVVVKELQLLISKLENFIEGKSPAVAAIVNPVLDGVSGVAVNMVEAAGNAAVTTPQSVE